jgi:hypothetical protein
MKKGQIIEHEGRFYLVLDVLEDGGLKLERISAFKAHQLRAAQRGMDREFGRG